MSPFSKTLVPAPYDGVSVMRPNEEFYNELKARQSSMTNKSNSTSNRIGTKLGLSTSKNTIKQYETIAKIYGKLGDSVHRTMWPMSAGGSYNHTVGFFHDTMKDLQSYRNTIKPGDKVTTDIKTELSGVDGLRDKTSMMVVEYLRSGLNEKSEGSICPVKAREYSQYGLKYEYHWMLDEVQKQKEEMLRNATCDSITAATQSSQVTSEQSVALECRCSESKGPSLG